MAHEDVVTIFHEFGHAMHSILTRAKYGRFAGTSVPGDFVEAPSQMLENWAWDKKVLDSFAADYRDPSKKIPAEILGKLKEAKLATEGNYYRRQLSFGLADMALHTQIHAGNEAGNRAAWPTRSRARPSIPNRPTRPLSPILGISWDTTPATTVTPGRTPSRRTWRRSFRRRPTAFLTATPAAFAPGDLRAGRFARRANLHREIPGPPAVHRSFPEKDRHHQRAAVKTITPAHARIVQRQQTSL